MSLLNIPRHTGHRSSTSTGQWVLSGLSNWRQQLEQRRNIYWPQHYEVIYEVACRSLPTSVKHAADRGLNPLNAELNPICHLLALLGAHHILHVSRIKVNNNKKILSITTSQYCFNNCQKLCKNPTYDIFHAL